jgi:hypothetical protein
VYGSVIFMDGVELGFGVHLVCNDSANLRSFIFLQGSGHPSCITEWHWCSCTE